MFEIIYDIYVSPAPILNLTLSPASLIFLHSFYSSSLELSYSCSNYFSWYGQFHLHENFFSPIYNNPLLKHLQGYNIQTLSDGQLHLHENSHPPPLMFIKSLAQVPSWIWYPNSGGIQRLLFSSPYIHFQSCVLPSPNRIPLLPSEWFTVNWR